MNKTNYTTPTIEIAEVQLEAGIATSKQDLIMQEIWLEEANGGEVIW